MNGAFLVPRSYMFPEYTYTDTSAPNHLHIEVSDTAENPSQTFFGITKNTHPYLELLGIEFFQKFALAKKWTLILEKMDRFVQEKFKDIKENGFYFLTNSECSYLGYIENNSPINGKMKIGEAIFLGFFENKKPHHLGKLFLDKTIFIGTFKNGFPNGHFCMTNLAKESWYAYTRCKINLKGEEEQENETVKSEKIYVYVQGKKFFSTMTHDLRKSVNQEGCFEGDSTHGTFIGKGGMYEGPFGENYTFGDGAIMIPNSYLVGAPMKGSVTFLTRNCIINDQYDQGRPIGVRKVMPFFGSSFTKNIEESNNNNQTTT